MTRIAIALAALGFVGCSETAHFHGPATYVMSAPNEASRVGTEEQQGLVCADMLAHKVVLRLGDGCVLYASPATGGHGATIASGQRCVLPLSDGGREVVVRSGFLAGDVSRGIEVTIGGNLVDRPRAYVAYRLSGGPPRMGGEGCEGLLAAAPSL